MDWLAEQLPFGAIVETINKCKRFIKQFSMAFSHFRALFIIHPQWSLNSA